MRVHCTLISVAVTKNGNIARNHLVPLGSSSNSLHQLPSLLAAFHSLEPSSVITLFYHSCFELEM